MPFAGFPSAAFDFYARLELDNSRPFWLANKATYDEALKAPFAALSTDVAARFGEMRLFRPHRDVRFSKDKSPYKTAAGAVTEGDDGSFYYVQVNAEGLFVGVGMYSMAADQLERWRGSVDNNRRGAAIVHVVESLRNDGYEIGAMQSLKTAPRGYPKDHARVELLRMKGLTMGRSFPIAKWLSTSMALDRIIAVWTDAVPMSKWLGKHVGPSELTPEDWTM